MSSDPDPKSTYADHTAALIDAPGGRFAPTAAAGTSLPVQWSCDLAAMPPEPPLGQRVDDVPDLGFPHEARLAREKAEAEAQAINDGEPPCSGN